MSKKTIPQLKQYFIAGKRPTESQFGDLLDSYVHLDKNLNSDFKDLNFSFPNNESNKAIDILFGNNYVNGFITVEIVGSFANQSSLGIIKKQFQVGANPDNSVWYAPTSRIAEAEGSILDNIYIGNFEWDPLISQYKITIYHTVPSGNPYNVKVSQQSVGELAVGKIELSGFYTRPVSGQNKHFINYNRNVGVGTTDPKARLQVIASASTPDQYGTFSLGDEGIPNLRMGHNNQYTWIQSHVAPLQINPIGNNTVLNRDGGNVGIGVNTPQSRLDVNGFVTSTMTDSSINSTNRVGFNISELGSNVFEMSYPRNGFGTAELKTIGVRHLILGTDNTERIRIHGATGNVGIGTQNPDQKLTVKGKIHAEDIIINTNVPADYVFEKYYDNYSSAREDYSMMNLKDLESFIKENKHLPEIPSGSEMIQDGIMIGDFQMKLLQKIEELTLYTIAQHKELENLKSQINNTNA
jgi:hypothetical protein